MEEGGELTPYNQLLRIWICTSQVDNPSMRTLDFKHPLPCGYIQTWKKGYGSKFGQKSEWSSEVVWLLTITTLQQLLRPRWIQI